VTAYVLSAAASTIAIVPFEAGLLRPEATVSVTKVWRWSLRSSYASGQYQFSCL